MGDVWQSVPSKPIEPLGTEAFEEDFARVSRTCFNLHERLPNVAIAPLTTQDVVTDWYRSQIDPVMIHAHALTLCALMTLYDIKAKTDQTASNIALEAAIHMVGVCRRIIDLDFLQLDIMLGMTWVTTCHILIRHARKLRKRNQPTEAVHADIDLVIFALRKLGKIFPLVGIQAERENVELEELHL